MDFGDLNGLGISKKDNDFPNVLQYIFIFIRFSICFLNNTKIKSPPRNPTMSNQPQTSDTSATLAHPVQQHPNKFFRAFGSLRLDNEGAVARDHLANERTYLTWMQSSLAFTSIGVAITQFFRLQSSSNIKSLIEASQVLSASQLTGTSTLVVAATDSSTSSPYTNTASQQPPSLLIQTPEFYRYVENMVIQDKKILKLSKMLGSWFIVTAIIIMLLGLYRYFVSQHYLQKGTFPVSRVSVSFLFTVTFAVSKLFVLNIHTLCFFFSFQILICFY